MEIIGQIVIGQGVPAFIDLINRKISDKKARFAVALLVCLILGVLATLGDLIELIYSPTLDRGLKIFQAGVMIFSSSQVAYKTYYENSILQVKIRNPLK